MLGGVPNFELKGRTEMFSLFHRILEGSWENGTPPESLAELIPRREEVIKAMATITDYCYLPREASERVWLAADHIINPPVMTASGKVKKYGQKPTAFQEDKTTLTIPSYRPNPTAVEIENFLATGGVDNVRQYVISFHPDTDDAIWSKTSAQIPAAAAAVPVPVPVTVKRKLVDEDEDDDNDANDDDDEYIPKRKKCYKIDCDLMQEARAIVVGEKNHNTNFFIGEIGKNIHSPKK